MSESKPLMNPRRETVRRVQIHVIPDSKAVFVKTGAPVVAALKEGGVQTGVRKHQFGHTPTVTSATTR